MLPQNFAAQIDLRFDPLCCLGPAGFPAQKTGSGQRIGTVPFIKRRFRRGQKGLCHAHGEPETVLRAGQMPINQSFK